MKSKRVIDNTQDIMDSRDVIEYMEEMESEREGFMDAIEEAEGLDEKVQAKEALKEWDEDNGAEYGALKAFCEEGEGATSDWIHGATLILDGHFKDYAQQFAEDIGAIDRAASWPNTCIDWDEAASELQMDYTSIDFDGETYWVR